MLHHLTTPLASGQIATLAAGDEILLTGRCYTARDAAHKRLIELIDAGKSLPADLNGHFLYYTGPTPPKPGIPIGSAGPTTSSRMDRYTPQLLESTGLAGLIGKGDRSVAVVDSLIKNQCVYCAATGGAGALLAQCIRKARVVCYEDLGAEAIYELELADFPLLVAIDTKGNNQYTRGPSTYRDRV